jgi:hypothetical protein
MTWRTPYTISPVGVDPIPLLEWWLKAHKATHAAQVRAQPEAERQLQAAVEEVWEAGGRGHRLNSFSDYKKLGRRQQTWSAGLGA